MQIPKRSAEPPNLGVFCALEKHSGSQEGRTEWEGVHT